MTREEILVAYADFAQDCLEKEVKKYGRTSNTVLCRPIINMFTGEFKGVDWRKKINGMAAYRPENAEYKHDVRKLILDGIEYYRGHNPEALQTRNG